MSLKNQWLLNIAMVAMAWLSLFFLGKRNIKRFFLSSILIVIVEGLTVQIGKKRKWWVFYNNPHSYFSGEFPFNIGPHLVGSMWILKWTYGNFKKFIMVNAVVDAFFTFPVINFMKKIKMTKLKRLSNGGFFLFIFSKCFLLYGFQYLVERKR
ncbi:hypothetical protein [Niallia sp. NCCP-28]|uniref:hypothetical protein n=1 Tax=Niallia sp. NCCP-28 TaxID=2934712 RepID=UPI00208BA612|nr:hypothetical protein [Niallia sp. NCCP-28]GKU82955.1 hypothetical protein NCCP28_23510 [Niallia sp. NCCP-28]